ncbi:MAG: hypothetical protein EOS63_03860 [Mesorhizobium sp.]|uniref:hypothetical protein n=1 Tax=Mesorhizobium sp. TaxID=1871066 RepID=UPI000FE9491F|nr:hypothetical protein [Mesorhizobium sp.]RWE84097.1 MAG: hypothetical protein EOS63_03860 [Mesorhizobium sp.]TIT13756.1 MAG: hypothetical protein E5W74_05110 [Mesorhizobium sp.]TJW63490.1 MAG: hypothetical protein E5V97_12110 [Mesorhizobium sp.]
MPQQVFARIALTDSGIQLCPDALKFRQAPAFTSFGALRESKIKLGSGSDIVANGHESRGTPCRKGRSLRLEAWSVPNTSRPSHALDRRTG